MPGTDARARKAKERKAGNKKKTCVQRGASIVPTKDRIDWPYVVRPVGILMMVAAAAHLLSAWVAFVIFGALWVFVMWSKTRR